MTHFIQYALAVGNSRPGCCGNVGYGRDRAELIEANRGGWYASNPQTLYGQTRDRRWHIVEHFESLKEARA